ncbi:hypothetical protein swp_1889 [Shewanella piezotolerans WP3]|uniref:Uncharacterized protein n=1 Tax=Shewanella piezotolerans (strain WP3 / JCM 13877) TaxID=225849 RepID=B8CLJ8_SHEPW|nr:hypothetical protein swp_1889 [Shewanella piezotolerans WP3]
MLSDLLAGESAILIRKSDEKVSVIKSGIAWDYCQRYFSGMR